jgi:hypothetical protein
LQLLICVNGIISSEQRTPLSVNFTYVPLSCQPAERDGAFDTGAESSLCLPECSGIESRDAAVHTQDDCLAIDDELLLAVLQSGFNDPGEALRPIVPAASNQPHPIAIALNTQAVAIELDPREAIPDRKNLGSGSGNAKLK